MSDEWKWKVGEGEKKKVVDFYNDVMDSDDHRSKFVAARGLVEIDKLNLSREQFVDQKERLDAGRPTGIIGTVVDARRAIDNIRDRIRFVVSESKAVEGIEQSATGSAVNDRLLEAGGDVRAVESEAGTTD
jgi:hypothetical protein